MPGLRIAIRGTVQGVGFRPWVARLAQELRVAGRVLNDTRGVLIEAFGGELALDGFVRELESSPPPQARIVELTATPIEEQAVRDFTIDRSVQEGRRAFAIPPDLATCSQCEREIREPSDRRYGYAFTNCTHCGPRFTIANGVPYDRARTTMLPFRMCRACRHEYEDPDDRRHHAQANACPACGPTLALVDLASHEVRTGDPLAAATALLQGGSIVGVKGLGGFHLACDAQSTDAVVRLRRRKRRDEKPFAVMVRDLAHARSLATLSDADEDLLRSAERPIVLAPRRPDAEIASEISLDTPLIGLFLPYTPLHLLLLAAVDRPLVMTSANPSDEPICRSNEEASDRLAAIADALLLHDRDIAMRCDDSVARVIAGIPTILRRSRGFVPRPLVLRQPVRRPILACGAHLKNTFCIAIDDMAYLGPHIGDLETVAALEFYEEAIERMETILDVRPEVVAHDLHPAYLSSRYALGRDGVERVAVQHHHAHIVSTMAEHGLEGPVLGLAFDGTGLGSDGTSWGGEVLLCSEGAFQRLATFRPVSLPGGDLAIREVWRIAYALLHDAFEGDPPISQLTLFDDVPSHAKAAVARMLATKLNTPTAHGVGRYFDAFGSIGLGRRRSAYEGQVAMAWDSTAGDAVEPPYPFELRQDAGILEIDLRPTTRALVRDVLDGVAADRSSARFHQTLIEASCRTVRTVAHARGELPLVMSGGVFQNARLAGGIESELRADFSVYRHREVPPGDGGIALGQAVIASAISARSSSGGAAPCA